MGNSVRIKTKDDLLALMESMVGSVARQSVRKTINESGLYTEEDAQVQQGAQASGAGAFDSGSQGNAVAAEAPPQENPDAPTYDMIVDKLNNIRSGRSFRDSAVKSAMKQYFEKLSEEERAALFAFMKGISQIVTGEIPGDQAMDPDDMPAPGIKMTKASGTPGGGKKVKNVTVIKSPKKAAGGAVSGAGAEDNSAPLPIKPRAR